MNSRRQQSQNQILFSNCSGLAACYNTNNAVLN
uniref:Uncharacterized protein n=1 Tax=Anguilla anguilla TaxID=7936 RepID=A0A0E9WHQ2_ANGAN